MYLGTGFGEWLGGCVTDANIDIASVALWTGISIPTVYKHLEGLVKPRVYHIAAYCVLFDRMHELEDVIHIVYPEREFTSFDQASKRMEYMKIEREAREKRRQKDLARQAAEREQYKQSLAGVKNWFDMDDNM